MNDFSYKLGKLSGFLNAFSYINHKTNHSYSFELSLLDNSLNIPESLTKHFSNTWANSTFKLEKISLKDKEILNTLEEWLFCYQHSLKKDSLYPLPSACLVDKSRDFSLSDKSTKKQITLDIIKEIKQLISTQAIYKVFITTDTWYEDQWNDFLFEGKHGRLFLHLGVSD